MPAYGGFAPSPERYGGAGSRFQVIFNSLAEQMGTAFERTPSSPLYWRLFATARALASLGDAGERLANQWIPSKLTVYLPRWERLLGIIPPPEASDRERREAVAERLQLFGVLASRPTIEELLQRCLAPIAFRIETTEPERALVLWPGAMGRVLAYGTDPPPLRIEVAPTRDLSLIVDSIGATSFRVSLDDGGTWETRSRAPEVELSGTGLRVVFPQGATFSGDERYMSQSARGEWSSSVASLTIVCSKPEGMSECEFYERTARAHAPLDRLLPAWMTWDLVRDDPSGPGFLLDRDHNLDNHRFDA